MWSGVNSSPLSVTRVSLKRVTTCLMRKVIYRASSVIWWGHIHRYSVLYYVKHVHLIERGMWMALMEIELKDIFMFSIQYRQCVTAGNKKREQTSSACVLMLLCLPILFLSWKTSGIVRQQKRKQWNFKRHRWRKGIVRFCERILYFFQTVMKGPFRLKALVDQFYSCPLQIP